MGKELPYTKMVVGGFMPTYNHPSDLDASIPRGSALLFPRSIFYWIAVRR